MSTLQDSPRQGSGTCLDSPSCRERLQACRHSPAMFKQWDCARCTGALSQVAGHTYIADKRYCQRLVACKESQEHHECEPQCSSSGRLPEVSTAVNLRSASCAGPSL